METDKMVHERFGPEAFMQKNKTAIRITVATALALSLAGNVFLQHRNASLAGEKSILSEQIDDLTYAKLDAQKQYAEAKNQMDALRGQNATLDQLINQKTKELDDAKMKIDQLTLANASLPALKKQIAELKKINADFLARVDALNAQNAQLTAENTTLKEKNSTLTVKVDDYSRKIDQGKELRAANIGVQSFRLKRNAKEIQTGKARKTDRITVDFDILANTLADAGKRNVQVILRDPSGLVMTEDENGDNYLASTDAAAAQTKNLSVDYDRNDTHLSVNYDYNNRMKLSKGVYTAEIYVDGKLAGKKEFSLK
ncbi:MAG TPA: hypothetical protein VFU15_15575 [Bacteroidia bacterium]|nr:hypothetical protein [Bacteroidia bacterium]